MKSKFLNSSLLVAAGLVLFISCKKQVEEITTRQYNFDNNAFIQVYLGTVGADRNYVYLDNTAIVGAKLVTGNIFPSTGYSASIPTGNRIISIKDTLSTSKQIPLSIAGTFSAMKNYTVFTYDTITSPKQVTVESIYTLNYDNLARLRFTNLIYSTTPLPAVDIFSVKKNANLFTNVPIGGVTDFITVPTNIADTLIVRNTGTTTQITALFGSVFQPQRYYSLVFGGSNKITSGTSASIRKIFYFANF